MTFAWQNYEIPMTVSFFLDTKMNDKHMLPTFICILQVVLLLLKIPFCHIWQNFITLPGLILEWKCRNFVVTFPGTEILNMHVFSAEVKKDERKELCSSLLYKLYKLRTFANSQFTCAQNQIFNICPLSQHFTDIFKKVWGTKGRPFGKDVKINSMLAKIR